MALDKLVDSTQLDADLTTVADAIRTKGGTSAQLSFPQGMADAIAAIPSGLPSVISKIDGGSFTLAANTSQNVYRISHNLGVAPTGVCVWTNDNDEWAAGSNSTAIFYVGINHTHYNGQTSQMGGGYYEAYRASNGNADKSSNVLIPTQAANAFRTNDFQVVAGHYFKGGATYKWVAYA